MYPVASGIAVHVNEKLVVDKLVTLISGVWSVSDLEHPEIMMAANAAKAKKSFVFIYL